VGVQLTAESVTVLVVEVVVEMEVVVVVSQYRKYFGALGSNN
jgi:hypothetical protein